MGTRMPPKSLHLPNWNSTARKNTTTTEEKPTTLKRSLLCPLSHSPDPRGMLWTDTPQMRGDELNKARMQGTKANAAKNAPRWIESNELGAIDANGAARGGICRASTVSEEKDAPRPV